MGSYLLLQSAWSCPIMLGTRLSETYGNLLTTAKFIIEILMSFQVSRAFKFLESWKPMRTSRNPESFLPNCWWRDCQDQKNREFSKDIWSISAQIILSCAQCLEHDLCIHHLHTSDWGGNFFEKVIYISLHHLLALSSCNTRFEGEKWELSQLEYSGEMQLLQKDFDMEKMYVDAC